MNLLSRLIIPLFVLCVISPVFAQTYHVKHIVDGDTIKLDSGETVRLIGVDTPECTNNEKARRDSQRTGQDMLTITQMGQEAKKYLAQILAGKNVRLEFDAGKRDRYGRLLAYVFEDTALPSNLTAPDCRDCFFLNHNGKWTSFVNARLVRAGFASPLTIPPNVKYAPLFKELFREAQAHRRGLWHDTRAFIAIEKSTLPQDIYLKEK